MALRVTAKLCASAFQRTAYKLSGFHKYGLMRDDMLDDFSDEYVQEGLRRLFLISPKTYDERIFRLTRALQLSVQRELLPKDQWMTIEDDVLYLTPLVDQYLKELDEIAEWEKDY